ncbi:hypothetical protein HPO96_16975 [Kribbella sandramycini]|uniref:Uncharacterized protein n=1 Tax=Kribbella sandramycini TaxID=60450 RepID=A0A7Y4NZE1_9ACTN|nr:hypothetical protein [Kribbella sandramycini]MBB6565679.1 hypothetical protein [Kribbella sandramycini]NOL41942.1 hypothetical protein [Kribbella sandramycini]
MTGFAPVAVIGPPIPAATFTAALDRAGLTSVRYDVPPDDLGGYAAVVVVGRYPEPARLAVGGLAAYVRAGGSAYVEFALDETGLLPQGELRPAHFERIVTTAALGGIEPLRILDEHSSQAQQVVAPEGAVELLTYATVAGTHEAVFGLPDATFPALLEIPVGAGRLLYATTALSHHVAGRYKPVRRWERLVQVIVARLLGVPAPDDVEVFTEPRVWVATGEPVKLVVRSAAKPEAELELVETAPGRYESEPQYLADGEHVFTVGDQQATVAVGPRAERYRRMVDRAIAWYDTAGMFYDAPDGSKGVAEGFSNEIDATGKLPFRPVPRGDCFTQTAHAFRMYADLADFPRGRTIAANLMRLVVEEQQLTDHNQLYGSFEPRGPRGDLTATNNLFADDNGWIALFALLSGYPESGLRGVESLIRTASAELGLQVDPWRTPSTLLVKGWDELSRSPIADGLDLTSHWQSSAQCAYLYAYGLTGEQSYLDIATRGLDHMAGHHPRARLETSRTCEAGRFLLPLVGAYQYTRKPLYLDILRELAAFLKSRQGPDGGFAEWDGKCPPSNEAYGVDEASIFQANGDPVTDQLYGTPFAAWALPLAYKVTGEPVFLELAQGVLDYLSRIQIDDPADAQLDGTWQRAFDFDAWEYFGSNADVGWGPYCVETGWSVAPTLIGAMLYLTEADFFPPAPDPGAGRSELVTSIRAEFDAIQFGRPAPVTFTRRPDGRVLRTQDGVPAVLGDLVAAGDPVWTRNEPTASYEIYVRGADNHLHHTYLDDRVGQGRWSRLGDLELADEPVVAFNPGANTIEVYVLGADGRIHHCSMIDVRGGHTPWEPVGTLHFTGSPAVLYDETLRTVRLVANDTAGQDRRTHKVNRWHLPWQDYSHWITA